MRLRGLLLMAAMVVSISTTTGARAASTVSVVQGTTYRTMMFPNDALTVADSNQLTGRRVNFRVGVDYPACSPANLSVCDVFTQLNRLDGFDLQPRVVIPFSGPIDVASINDSNVFIQGPGGRTGLVQLVWDPAANTLAGISNGFLHENSVYSLVVTSFVKDPSGAPVNACGGTCVVSFTTRTASAELDSIRRALDSGAAYTAAGLTSTASRQLGFVQGSTNEVFVPALIQPSVAAPSTGILRLDQAKADTAAALVSTTVPNLVNPLSAQAFAFGSFSSPRYQYRSADFHHDDPFGLTDGEIPMLPSTQTPQPFGADEIGVVLVLPATPAPAGGYPVAIYGPGFTRSKLDILVTADENATLGIATIATDPAGHAYGPNSQLTITQGLTSTTLKTFGRGHNLNGDGLICDGLYDGVGPVAHVTSVDSSKTACKDQSARDLTATPSRKPVDGLRSGLMQTVIDNMALARSVALGVNVPTIGDVMSHTNISYYGLSFGGIYGTMLMGTDPMLHRGLLNVPGGPIVDIARLSGFRGNLRDTLKFGQPDTRNGGPGLQGFTESIPLRGDPPMTNPVAGAIQLQELFGNTNWFDRPGSPETFAPLLRDRPLVGSAKKDLIFQTAWGDHTVPNPTAGNLYRAGNLWDVVTIYRNDHSIQGATTDPHGWLADPTIDARARTAGQLQMGRFLLDGTRDDPNTFAPAYPGHGSLFDFAPLVKTSNLSCLHYADPQTGQPYAPVMDEPDCPVLAVDQHIWLDPVALDALAAQSSRHLAGLDLPNSSAASSEAVLLLGGLFLLAALGLSRVLRHFRRRPA